MNDLDRERVAECENAFQEAHDLGATWEEAQKIADLVEEGSVDWEGCSTDGRREWVVLVKHALAVGGD